MDPTNPAIDYGTDPMTGEVVPPGWVPGDPLSGYGGGYGGGSFGGGTTITAAGGPTSDPWGSFFSNFPKFAGGISTIVSSVQGKPYAQGPYGASGGGMQPPGLLGTSGGIGISTTTLLLILAAVFFVMKK
jgi:hypothetical protein